MIELTPSRIEILKIWAKDFLRIYQTEDFAKEELEFIEEILSNEPSDWCRAMYEKTLDPAYITLYNMWKEWEDAKIRRNGRDS